MRSDDVVRNYAGSGIKLTIRKVPSEENARNENEYVLIEGSQLSLRFLAEMLLAVAEDVDDDGRQLHPRGPGSDFFSQESELGLYLYLTGSHRPQPR